MHLRKNPKRLWLLPFGDFTMVQTLTDSWSEFYTNFTPESANQVQLLNSSPTELNPGDAVRLLGKLPHLGVYLNSFFSCKCQSAMFNAITSLGLNYRRHC